jgi:hypothetical protein
MKQLMEAAFDRKAKDLGFTIDFTAFDSIINTFENIKTKMRGLRDRYIVNGGVRIAELRRRLEILGITKDRYSQEWNAFIEERVRDMLKQDQAETRRETLREELRTHGDEIYRTHFSTINRVLQELRADFRLVDFQPLKHLIGERERLFRLEFFGAYRVTWLRQRLINLILEILSVTATNEYWRLRFLFRFTSRRRSRQ